MQKNRPAQIGGTNSGSRRLPQSVPLAPFHTPGPEIHWHAVFLMKPRWGATEPHEAARNPGDLWARCTPQSTLNRCLAVGEFEEYMLCKNAQADGTDGGSRASALENKCSTSGRSPARLPQSVSPLSTDDPPFIQSLHVCHRNKS